MRISILALFLALPMLSRAQSAPAGDTQVPVTFTGGYDTDPRDHGRPVVLVAAALNVPSDVFRETFTHVHPAHAGSQPEPDQVRKNKQALMAGLSPYGVTDERLNEVSNFYRYPPGVGAMWRHVPATAVATVHNGAVTKITITSAGSGYTSPPGVTVPGAAIPFVTVKLSYGTDFDKNGSIQEVAILPDAPNK